MGACLLLCTLLTPKHVQGYSYMYCCAHVHSHKHTVSHDVTHTHIFHTSPSFCNKVCTPINEGWTATFNNIFLISCTPLSIVSYTYVDNLSPFCCPLYINQSKGTSILYLFDKCSGRPPHLSYIGTGMAVSDNCLHHSETYNHTHFTQQLASCASGKKVWTFPSSIFPPNSLHNNLWCFSCVQPRTMLWSWSENLLFQIRK